MQNEKDWLERFQREVKDKLKDVRYYAMVGDKLRPANIQEFSSILQSNKVAYTEVGRRSVSTVFLGLNHQWGKGLPQLFETMIFGDEGDGEEGCWRYSSIGLARRGHQQIVECLEQGRPPEVDLEEQSWFDFYLNLLGLD